MNHGLFRRSSITWAIAVGALLAALLPGATGVGAATPAACVDGFSRIAPTGLIMPEDSFSNTAAKVFTAGGMPLSGGKRAARIATYGKRGWRTASTMRLGTDSGYVALGGTPYSGMWAVGYVQTRTSMSPLTSRRKADGSWRRVRAPRPPGGATLADVAAHQRSSAWAVGYRLGRPGVRLPYALRWGRGRWNVSSPQLRSGERGALTAVSTTKLGGTWIAGSTNRFGSTYPYIAKRVNGKWTRQQLPAAPEGVLAAITVSSIDHGWAVGHQFKDGKLVPLLLHWDGANWQKAMSPDLPGDTLLFDISQVGPDSISVSGSTWDLPDRRMKAFVATGAGADWETVVYDATPKHSVFTSVDRDPAAGGWVVGRDLKSGVAARTCAPVTTAAVSTQRTRALRQQRREATATARSGISDEVLHPAEADAEPRSDLSDVPALKIAAAGGVTMRDRARAVGLPTVSTTHGAVIKDFDRDGKADIFLNGHSRPAALYLDRGATFRRSGLSFGWGDRHGCDAADIDHSGLPDLYCSFGGGRGLGVKGNQLWRDPGKPGARLAARVGGAPEPLSRGREVVFLDANKDGFKDLFVGQQQNRADGLPSTNRVYLSNGDGTFRPMPKSGIATGIGVSALDTGDVDQDGRVDLLMVFSDPQSSGATSGIRLYRNTPSGFRGVHASYGIKSIGERDAELVRLNGDARPDLVQLSGDRIRVSLQSGGKFRKVFERKISNAVAVAAGDADGDGDTDLYVLRQKNKAGIKDIVLFNRGGGRSFRAVAAPSRSGGKADDVVAIDHDQNGLTDFLALNGGSAKGPVQLISFYR